MGPDTLVLRLQQYVYGSSANADRNLHLSTIAYNRTSVPNAEASPFSTHLVSFGFTDIGWRQSLPPVGAGSVNDGFRHRHAELGAQEVEVAALVGLLDVLGIHPAVAPLEPGRRRRPFHTALG